jgi:two-component system, OmpR family, osmolarity sensor histidine kinase EnvZ
MKPLFDSATRPLSGRRISIKSLMPASLFSRALLILLIPVVVLQLLVAHVFYDRHWNSVVRNMSATTAADVAMLVHEYEALSLKLGTQEALTQTMDRGGRRKFPDFYDNLNANIKAPLAILNSGEEVIHVRVNAHHGVLDFSFSRKRLASSTTWIFILWMMGSGALLTTIAIVFLRNQVRPIVALARAAEQFGLGQDVDNFSPRGASEVRRAGRAFVMMAERTRRHVQSRTEMLAGISHDLRTPLTRMKLELEMGKVDAATREALSSEIEEMRSMIDEYLDFASGDAGELPEPIDVALLLNDIVAQYQRGKQQVTAAHAASVTLMLRPQAMRRAVTNIIDNALRYGGGQAVVALEQSLTFVRIKITDRGPGIPENEQESVFKPFTRLEPSRNLETGGVGLGLSIARAVAQSHGGEVVLENQRDTNGNITGLEVTLRLPREVQGLSS